MLLVPAAGRRGIISMPRPRPIRAPSTVRDGRPAGSAEPVCAVRLAGPARRVLRAGALVAQSLERVEARVMPVAPRRGDGVLADELEIGELGLDGRQRRLRVEPSGLTRFSTTERTRAEPAQRHEVVAGDVAVGPLDLELRRLAVGVDAPRREVLP